MVTVDFIFDFASPNAYMAHRAIADIGQRTGATFRYLPCLLGGIFKATNNRAPFIAYAEVKGKLAYEQLEMVRFIKKHQLTKFSMNPNFPVNSLMLMRAAVSLQDDPRFMDYIEAGLVAMWEDGKKMDDPDIFAETLSAAGFDGPALLAASQNPEIKSKLATNTEQAVEKGVFGIPMFFVGDEMFMGKDRLDQVEEAILAAG